MQKLIQSAFLILLLIPFSQAISAQISDTPATLSVYLPQDRQSVYFDSDGHVVIVGIAENRNSLTPITNVILQARFIDESDPDSLEIIVGTTILDVIPANGFSPFMISTKTINPNISQASVSLLGFDSSPIKEKGLTVFSTDVFLDASLHFSGVLQNGGAPSSNTNVYLAFYNDNFEPTRILRISTIEIGDVELNAEKSFEFNELIDSNSSGFLLFSESDVFLSDFIDVKIPPPQTITKLVTISDVSVEDTTGNKLSEIPVGSTVNIKSKTLIKFATDPKSNETAYSYYVQIKESETSSVEFIEKFDGRFIGTGTETQSIDWIPQKSGLYFIETFVWDRNNVPIAEQGPFVIVNVN